MTRRMPCRKSRILIFSSSYLPVLGGVQTAAHNVAKQLVARGHEVRVVTNRYPIALAAHETIDGVRIDRLIMLKPRLDQLRRGRPDLLLASLWFAPQTHLRLMNLFKKFQPEVVNVHFPDHQIEAVNKLRNRFNFRLVVSLHGHDVERFANGNQNGSLTRSLRLRRLLQTADAVTAVSQDLLNKANQLEPTIFRKSRVIQNGVDSDLFKEPTLFRHSKPYIVALGRLTFNKGFDLLIEAFARCQINDRPDLIIAGAGEDQSALVDQVKRLGLQDAVHFCGHVPREQVPGLLKGSLGVVVPSRSESFGIVALEALAAGRPLLASKTGGLAELANDLIGNERSVDLHDMSLSNKAQIVLVEPTVEGIASALPKLFLMKSSKTGFHVPQKYSWSRIGESYETVLVEANHS